MSGAFDALSPALQHQLVNTLGFRELRPVQNLSIEAILRGDNAVVLAPTAGGKTEAAFFPLLSRMDTEDWRPVSLIYLSPIRALLNNQEDRVARYADLIGRRAFKWHGDVAQSARKRFLRDPADVLLITPEALEAMLMSARIPARELFAGLEAVIIDEVHAFANDDRGAHLISLLERLTRFCRKDLQRIGLSATVGNPEEILQWLRGSSARHCTVVDPKGERIPPELKLDYVGTAENAARVIQLLHPGKKRLAFVDSRRGAEQLGELLTRLEVQAFVSHGSLAVEQRKDAERAFQDGTNCVIVATSALELGIDVGDLDHVLQLDCPPTVASFLQRMGRTGRRPGTTPNCTFLCTKDNALLQAAAILQLFREGFVEPVAPGRREFHILAHQLLALSIQQAGVGSTDWHQWLEGCKAFIDIADAERTELVDYMLGADILATDSGKLWLGQRGEREFGRANFRELYAVFDAPRAIAVRNGTEDVGTVDAAFLATIDSASEPGSFLLAGKPWQIITIEWTRGICIVRPAQHGRTPRWFGAPQHLSYELCQAMRRILTTDSIDPSWSSRAQSVLATMRAEHLFLRDERSPITQDSDKLVWWTYAGGAANVLLARMLETELGGECTSNNFSVRLQGAGAKSLVAVKDAIRSIRDCGGPTIVDATAHSESTARGRISKFQSCLPERLLLELFVKSCVDVEGARRVVAEFQ